MRPSHNHWVERALANEIARRHQISPTLVLAYARAFSSVRNVFVFRGDRLTAEDVLYKILGE